MAIKDDIKELFKTDKTPVGADYETWIDSMATQEDMDAVEESMLLIADEVGTVASQLADTAKVVRNIKAPSMSPFELIAHRGFGEVAPENTISAYSIAVNLGVKSLECDVNVTSDGVLILMHDTTLDRTTSGTGAVKSTTYDQIKDLDAGSKLFGERFATSRIPTFDAFVKFAKARVDKIYPEIKGYRSSTDIEAMVNVIKDNDAERMTTLQASVFNQLNTIRPLSKDIKFCYLSQTDLTTEQYDLMEQDGNCMALIYFRELLDKPEIVNKCYSRGIDLATWTVNDRFYVDELLNIGVSKIMCDKYIGGVY